MGDLEVVYPKDTKNEIVGESECSWHDETHAGILWNKYFDFGV